MTKLRLGSTSYSYYIPFVPIESVWKPSTMAGSHNATTQHNTIPYHHSKRVGWVVGFWVGFSLGTCCRIWLEPPIPFILLLDSLHTYIMCLKAFNHGWQSWCHNTIPYHHSKTKRVGWVVRFWVRRHWIEHISVWGCILMTTSHCSRCWNTLYIYI
jgi:hypothetical protein